MKLILAQGNPGSQYSLTRHNIGFLVIDAIAQQQGIEFINKPKFHSAIAEYSSHGEKVLLVKPTTYYNETGRAARAIADFYKLDPARDLLVIHDELALPFGTLRTRSEGSDAGNNGVKSIIAHIGPAFSRIKIGIYSPLRDQINDADFVLSKFTQAEQQALPALINQAATYTDAFIDGALAPTKITLSLPLN